jgi:hypothetical protein
METFSLFTNHSRLNLFLMLLLALAVPSRLHASSGPPYVTTQGGGWIGNEVQLNGTAGDYGGDVYAWFQWGTTTDYGNLTSPVVNPQGPLNPSGGFSALLSGFTFTPNTAYHFQAVASNYYSTVYGSDATFIIPGPPVITNQPQSQTVAAGATVTFTVGAWTANVDPFSNLSYQWMKDSVAIPSATTSTLTITNAQYSDAGSYSVTVSNIYEGGWVILSDPATLTFQAAPPPAPFFTGQVPLGNDWYYLAASSNNVFGYYSIASFPFVYHNNLGFEYCVDANNAASGAYFYDFTSSVWFYTEPNLFPILYDFNRSAWLYYSPDTNNPGTYTSNPRWFYDYSANQWTTNMAAQ